MSETTPTARPAVGQIRTDAEHADLLSYHVARLREQRAEVDKAKGPVKTAKAALTGQQEELTKRFNEAKVDLGRGYTREYLDSLLKDGDSKVRDLVAFEKQRARDKPILNQPVFGIQPELFPGEETPTLVRDEMAWKAEGYLRGLRGDLREIQDGDPPEFHQAIMESYRAGQTETQAAFLRGQELKQRIGQPDPAQAPVNLNPPEESEPEPGTPEAKAAERKAIRRAKEALGVPAANKVPA